MTAQPHQTSPATSAIMNIEDYTKAMLNILEDFAEEKTRLEEMQRAVINILEDFTGEKGRLEETQRAAMNIMEDFAGEKTRLEETQRAMLNLLEDFDVERSKTEAVNRELLDRTTQLEAANRELEGFSYSVSHDLRAPLRHITGFALMLQKKAAPILDETTLHYLDTISESAKQMGVLIDDLLAFSRIGRSEVKKSRVSLGRLVKGTLKDLEEETRDRDIAWNLGELPEAYCDSSMLRLVFVNLISNAVKFTRPRAKAKIEIGCIAEKDEFIFFVRDNGVGFDPKYQDKLFGVFQRLHHQDEFEGTGIGLANVRRLIHRHGGRTWAEGEIANGATFYFSLPQSDILQRVKNNMSDYKN
jgi:light-regulated signal transduction histidine kinase (bacteriophytochrome)